MLENVRTQIEQLIARYEAEKAEKELESEIETRKLTEAFSGGAATDDVRAKVDKLIKEIDKCISYLEDA